MRRSRSNAFAIALLTAFALQANSTRPIIDRARREVRFAATIQPNAMTRPFGVQGHHAIVWSGGSAKTWALFVTDVSDHDVRLALDSLGAKRGENLTAETWTARENPLSREPDKRVEGAPVEVFVEWRGSRGRVPLARLLSEKDRDAPALDFRYGGNERWQEQFHSGCIVCLYSCPGGAIGNHAHTIRDSVRDGVVYASLPERLPPAGTNVTIILKVGGTR
ncbi:MAG TPA: YdjY domain-containing protein [Thermoanaerobaculia bacterium]|nr:YdjY domain-containing protein [Thermoanaerobaculia bacterium]